MTGLILIWARDLFSFPLPKCHILHYLNESKTHSVVFSVIMQGETLRNKSLITNDNLINPAFSYIGETIAQDKVKSYDFKDILY